MDARYLAGILAGLICLAILIAILSWLSRRRRDQAAQAYLAEHRPPGRSYAVGSPEHNAQIVALIRQVNEHLAKEGKHVPERIAMDIIIDQEQDSSSQKESE